MEIEVNALAAVIGLVLLVAGPGGAVWVGLKVSLNGMRQDVGEIKRDVKGLHSRVTSIQERTAKLEGAREENR